MNPETNNIHAVNKNLVVLCDQRVCYSHTLTIALWQHTNAPKPCCSIIISELCVLHALLHTQYYSPCNEVYTKGND